MDILLSYATEDKDRVDDAYRYFRAVGLSPWMDKPPVPFQEEGIPPGSDWDAEIRAAIQRSEVVLAFLSSRSIEKKSYVQREFRLALSRMMEMPPHRPFVIPVLLEACELPDVRVDTIALRSLHRFDLYARGIDELARYLKGTAWSEPGSTTRRTPEDLAQWNPATAWDAELASMNGLMLVYFAWLAQQRRITADLRELCDQLYCVDFEYAYGFLVALRAANLIMFRSDFKAAWHFDYVNPALIMNVRQDLASRIAQVIEAENEGPDFATPFEADIRRIEDYVQERAAAFKSRGGDAETERSPS